MFSPGRKHTAHYSKRGSKQSNDRSGDSANKPSVLIGPPWIHESPFQKNAAVDNKRPIYFHSFSRVARPLRNPPTRAATRPTPVAHRLARPPLGRSSLPAPERSQRLIHHVRRHPLASQSQTLAHHARFSSKLRHRRRPTTRQPLGCTPPVSPNSRTSPPRATAQFEKSLFFLTPYPASTNSPSPFLFPVP